LKRKELFGIKRVVEREKEGRKLRESIKMREKLRERWERRERIGVSTAGIACEFYGANTYFDQGASTTTSPQGGQKTSISPQGGQKTSTTTSPQGGPQC